MDDTTDPRAVEAWGDAAAIHIAMTCALFSERSDAAAAVIASYGDQRAAEERERCVAFIRLIADGLSGRPQAYIKGGLLEMADALARGDHLKGDGDGFPENAAIALNAFGSVNAVRGETVPTFQHPCGRRTVIVGKWGHMLAHPNDCPDCAALRDAGGA